MLLRSRLHLSGWIGLWLQLLLRIQHQLGSSGVAGTPTAREGLNTLFIARHGRNTIGFRVRESVQNQGVECLLRAATPGAAPSFKLSTALRFGSPKASLIGVSWHQDAAETTP